MLVKAIFRFLKKMSGHLVLMPLFVSLIACSPRSGVNVKILNPDLDKIRVSLTTQSHVVSGGPTRPVAISMNFNRDVMINLASLNISVVGGTLDLNSLSGSGSNYSFNVFPSADGPMGVSIPAQILSVKFGQAFQDKSSNAASTSFLVDSVSPLIILATNVTSPTNFKSIPVTISINKPISNLKVSDIVKTGAAATISDFSGANGNYQFTLKPGANGDIVLKIPANKIQDTAGNWNPDSNELVITYDNTVPIPKLSSTVAAITNSSSIPVVLEFKDEFNQAVLVTGLLESEFVVTNGSIQNFTGSGHEYSFNLIPTSDGLVSVKLPAGLVQNPSGILNTESNTLSFTVDRVAPGITVQPASILKGSVATTFTWVVDYVGADQGILLSPSQMSITTSGTVNCGSPIVTGTGNIQRQVSISGCTGDGILSFTILVGSVVDLAGNVAGSVTSNQVIVDNTPPAITIGAPIPVLGNMNSTFTWTVSYTGAQSTNLRMEDISILGDKAGCTRTVTPSGNTHEYLVQVTGCTGNGAVNFSIAAGTALDDIGLAALGATSPSVTVDNIIPFINLASLTPATGNAATTFQLPVNFQGAISAPLNLSHISIEGSGSAGCLPSVLGAYPNYTVEVKNCIGDGQMRVKIAAGVAEDAAGNLSASYSTPFVVVDNIVPTISISAGNPLIGNSTKTFSWDVTYINAANIYLTKNSIILNSTINNCTIEDVLEVSPSVYRVSIKSCSGNGTLSFQIDPGTGSDLAGNITDTAFSNAVTVDNLAPNLTISNPFPNMGHAGTVFTWELNYPAETLPTLTNADITLGGFFIEGCTKTLVQNSSFHYTLSVTGCSALTGNLTFTVAEGSGHDAAGNPTPTVVSNSVNISNVFPTVMVSAPSPSTGDKNTIFTFNITYTDASNITLNPSGIELSGSTMGCVVENVTGTGSVSRVVTVKSCTGSNKFAIKVKPGSATTSFGNTDSGSTLSPEAILTNQLIASFTESSSFVEKQATNHTGSFTVVLSDKAPSPVTIQYNVTSFTTATAADYNLTFGTVTIPQGQSTGLIGYNYFGSTSTGSRIIQPTLLGGSSSTTKVAIGKYQVDRRIVVDPALNVSFSKVAVGLSHSCGLTTANKIMCWGDNSNDQLGDKTNILRTLPTAVFGNKTYIDVSTNGNHSCGLTSANKLECWGPNGEFQLGTTTVSRSNFPREIDGPLMVKSFSVGGTHTCAIAQDDTLSCWGSNSNGQLGVAGAGNFATAQPVDNGVLYAMVSAGAKHTCGITKSNGTLKCWGDNTNGQLGNGSAGGASLSVPTAVVGGLEYKSVSLGSGHTCAITTANNLYCWGANSLSQLGNGNTTQLLVPTMIDGPNQYESVSAGRGNYTCGTIKTSGFLKCWGSNAQGQLGDGTTSTRTIGFIVDAGSALPNEYANISAGVGHTCGVLKNGTTKCWGYNGAGGVGDGVTELFGLPTKLDDNQYLSLSAGETHTCSLDQLNNLRCWGQNKDGNLGDGTTFDKSSPTNIDLGTTFKKISTGSRYSCGITQSDVLKCWGVNNYGQLGDGTTATRHIPVTIDSVPYKEVSTGDYHTCGITTAGVLKCWGYNANGELGDGSSQNRFTPVVIDSGTIYATVSAGTNHTCGITNNVLKCWGFNNKGQLGDGTIINKNAPVVVDLGTPYLNVSLGKSFSCGTTTFNTLKCWGLNENGQLGTSNASDSSVPMDIASNIATVSAGNAHACSLSPSGQLKCWGANGNSQLGNNQIGASNIAIEIDPGINYSAIDLGAYHTCGITMPGILKCWGSNKNGQIGVGNLINLPSPVLIP